MTGAVTPDVVLAVLPGFLAVASGFAFVIRHALKTLDDDRHQFEQIHRQLQSHMDALTDTTAALYGTVNQMKGKPRPGKEWVEYDPILAAGADIVPEFEQTIVGWMSASGAERISRDTTSWYGWDAMFELSSPIPVAWVAEYGESSEEPQPIIETVLRWRRCDVAAGETWLPAPKDLTPL